MAVTAPVAVVVLAMAEKADAYVFDIGDCLSHWLSVRPSRSLSYNVRATRGFRDEILPIKGRARTPTCTDAPPFPSQAHTKIHNTHTRASPSHTCKCAHTHTDTQTHTDIHAHTLSRKRTHSHARALTLTHAHTTRFTRVDRKSVESPGERVTEVETGRFSGR